MAEVRHHRGKLRNKIFLLMLLVSIVPVFIAASLSVYSVTLSHKRDVASLESALIDQKYGEIQNFMISAGGGIKTAYPFPVTIENIDFGRTKTAIAATLSYHPEIQEFTWINPSGTEIFKLSKSSPDGVPDSALQDESQSEVFLTAKEGRNYSGPIYSSASGPMITVAFPVFNSEKQVISVTRGEISLLGVNLVLKNASLGNGGYLYLVDSSGAFMGGGLGAGSSTDMRGTGIVSDVIQGKDFLGPDGQRRYNNYFGEEVVAAGKYLPDYKWGLIAEWPAKEADASVNDLIYKNITVSAAVFLAVIIVSIILAVLIVRPVRKLEKGTELVAQGKFDETVDIKSGDELEELGEAFNKMMVGLKQLEELKNEFVFIAAHELRTPVAAMKGYLTLIRDGAAGPITEKTKEFVTKVIGSNQRLIQLVNDLLEVSRSEAGRLAIKVSPVDVVQAIDAALVEIKPLADQKEMEMSYEIPENLPKVLADPDRLKEVVVNLVGNAIKYNDPKGRIFIGHEVKGGNLITYVKDNGFGISKDAQTKLFEKFYRVQTDKTKDITGTGLGLFIVKEIVEKMNGRIWVESEERKGSTFSFSLPKA